MFFAGAVQHTCACAAHAMRVQRSSKRTCAPLARALRVMLVAAAVQCGRAPAMHALLRPRVVVASGCARVRACQARGVCCAASFALLARCVPATHALRSADTSSPLAPAPAWRRCLRLARCTPHQQQHAWHRHAVSRRHQQRPAPTAPLTAALQPCRACALPASARLPAFSSAQLTDVDPPYGQAPTAQLADRLAGQGRAAELLEGPREMVLTTQVRTFVFVGACTVWQLGRRGTCYKRGAV